MSEVDLRARLSCRVQPRPVHGIVLVADVSVSVDSVRTEGWADSPWRPPIWERDSSGTIHRSGAGVHDD